MAHVEASRTLVKSNPELWAECSDAASLARHLGAFGEIRITKLEPETAVAWEGDDVRGTVTLEPAGWGTRVLITASTAVEAADAEQPEAAEPMVAGDPEPAAVVEPEPAADPEPPVRPGFLRRLFGGRRRSPAPAASAQVAAEPDPEAGVDELLPTPPEATEPEPAPAAVDADPPPAPEPGPQDALADALDSLGRAHHRPFSRG